MESDHDGLTGEVEAEQVPERRRQVGKLSRPWIKRQLCRDLATGDLTERQLAEKYDCAPSAINQFKQRNATEINAIRDDLENEFAGIWIAQKENRVEVYRQQVDYLQARIDEGLEDDPQGALKVAQAALKLAAEEMGQLTARVAVQGEVTARVEHRITSVDVEALK